MEHSKAFMQHNRKIMLSSSETCHIGSSSSNSAMDQQNLLPSNSTVDGQNLHPLALESERYPQFLLNSHEVGMPNGRMVGQQNTGLSLWDSAGSSSVGCLVDPNNFFEAKRDHFTPALSIGGPLTIERRRHEGSSSLPSHNLNIDLNLNQTDQSDTDNGDMVQSNGHPGVHAFPLNRGLSTREHVLHHEISSEALGSSSRTVNLFDSAAGQEFGRFGGHRSSCKRKNIHGSFAESSANGSSRNHHHNNNILLPSSSTHEDTTSLTMPTSTDYGFSYPPIEHLNQNTNTLSDGNFADHYSLYGDPHESERFLRNTRIRISPNEYDQAPPNFLPEGTFRCSAYTPTQQQSSFIPVQPRAMGSSSSSHSRPHLPAVTQFSQSLHRPPSSGNLRSRTGSSSSATNSQDPNLSLLRSDLPEPFLLGSLVSADSTSLLSAPGSRSNQQNPSPSSTLQGAVNVGPQQISALNASQSSSSVMARRSLLAASVSQSRTPGATLQHRGHSSISPVTRSQQPGSSSRANQHYVRAAPPSLDRQGSSYMDLHSFMQNLAASRDGSRTVSELRNMVDQIRQSRSARLEGLLLADHSLIARRANLIDRHRDMRLDVDNMSYEELLALGERIGYVSTGLSEEQIMNGLKQWKYVCISLEEPPTAVEPCCICQEDYTDGEQMGRLDCGHDFHTACIKQWLVIKNLCPICKKTALGT